jgi:nitroreductase
MTNEALTGDRIAFLRGLRSVRQFRDDPVPRAALDDILEVARWSGSGRNLQPWEFVVVRDRALMRELAALEGFAKHLAGAALGIVVVLPGEMAEMEAFDEGKLTERMMLAASAHGLGSCIGWFGGAGREAARKLVGAPEGGLVRTVISIGYPDEEARRARSKPPEARKPLSKLIHQDRYGSH